MNRTTRRLPAALLLVSLIPQAGHAYTAAGDRTFSANLLLDQIAPSDAFWTTYQTQPAAGAEFSSFSGTYAKTITERLGIQLSDGILRTGSVSGAANFDALIQYEAILDPEREFALGVQLDRNFGNTGYTKAGTQRGSLTTPGITFGKGLGDVPVEFLRPFAVVGFAGFGIGESGRRNVVNAGFAIQYSFPYLVSKVAGNGVPSFLSGFTPTVEALLSTPTGGSPPRGGGTQRSFVIAPGFGYTQGSGWEFGIEALVPTSRASGTHVGVIAQLLVQFDYLLPDSILGKPLIGSE